MSRGLVSSLISLYALVILVRVLGSWFNLDWYRQPWRFLYEITEPVLAPARRLIPPIGGTLDISAMIVLFVLFTVAQYLTGIGL